MKLLTVKQLAEQLQMSESWVHKQIRLGAFRPRRFGRCVRFTEAEVARIIAGTTESPTVSPAVREDVQVVEKSVRVTR